MERLRRLARRVRNAVLPRRCIGCETPLRQSERLTCSACDATLRCVRSPQCPTCALPRPRPTGGIDAPCSTCLDIDPAQERGFARWLYDGAVAAAIQRAKYAGEIWRLRALGEAMQEWIATDVLETLADFDDAPLRATAVPMHPADLRDRGFNQSVQLARYALDPFDIRTDWNLLSQEERSRPQAGLTRGERLRNVRGLFGVRAPTRIEGTRWLVFDDVCTSGATLAEITGELVEAGADSVFTVVAARTPDDQRP